MKLNLGMLNENDLFMLLENLDKNASGLYSVKECSIKQDTRGRITLEPNQKNVDAACELLWFSINLGNNETVMPP
jgi:hypothetical protein